MPAGGLDGGQGLGLVAQVEGAPGRGVQMVRVMVAHLGDGPCQMQVPSPVGLGGACAQAPIERGDAVGRAGGCAA